MSIFAPPRITTPSRSGDQTCQIFAWIGQPFSSCNNCGRPVQEHLYHPPYGGQRPIFHVKQWIKWRDEWVWRPVGSFVNGGAS